MRSTQLNPFSEKLPSGRSALTVFLKVKSLARLGPLVTLGLRLKPSNVILQLPSSASEGVTHSEGFSPVGQGEMNPDLEQRAGTVMFARGLHAHMAGGYPAKQLV